MKSTLSRLALAAVVATLALPVATAGAGTQIPAASVTIKHFIDSGDTNLDFAYVINQGGSLKAGSYLDANGSSATPQTLTYSIPTASFPTDGSALHLAMISDPTNPGTTGYSLIDLTCKKDYVYDTAKQPVIVASKESLVATADIHAGDQVTCEFTWTEPVATTSTTTTTTTIATTTTAATTVSTLAPGQVITTSPTATAPIPVTKAPSFTG